MGEGFRKIGQWAKEHKGLAIALSGGILLLIYLYYRSQANAAAQANAASAAQAATGMPSDQILSQEIQAQATLQQEQIAAQAQTAQYQYQAQVDVATVQAQAYASNAQNQAALTLGLAQAGDSTQSILQLLGAQPGTMPTTSVMGNTTTAPTASATLTGAAPTGGTGVNTMGNPAPAFSLPPPATPAQAAAGQPLNLDWAGNPVTCPPGTHWAAGACVQLCNQADIAAADACVQGNQTAWDAAGAAQSAGLNHYIDPTTGQVITFTPPLTSAYSPATTASPGGTAIQTGTTSAAQLPARGAVYQSIPPRLSAHTAVGDVAAHTVTEADVTGTVGGHATITNDVFYSTPGARANLADLMARHAVVSPSVVPGSGGPFYNPPVMGDIVSASGFIDSGGIMNSIHNANPADRTAILAGYGIQNWAGVHSSISDMFGPNEPLPPTLTGVA